MKQFLSFVRKEFYHVFRDSKTLLMLFGLPIVLIVLFGFAVTNEIKNAKIIVCDYAKDPASQEIINKLSVNTTFNLEKTLLNHSQIEEAFKKENIKLAIVFPANFNKDLLHLNKAQVQIIADASDPNTATTLINNATAVIMDYQMELMQNSNIPFSIAPEIRMLYNPELKGATNFVPGIMALVLLLVCVLMTAVSIVKEKETGTMEILLVFAFQSAFSYYFKSTSFFAFIACQSCCNPYIKRYLVGYVYKWKCMAIDCRKHLAHYLCFVVGFAYFKQYTIATNSNAVGNDGYDVAYNVVYRLYVSVREYACCITSNCQCFSVKMVLHHCKINNDKRVRIFRNMERNAYPFRYYNPVVGFKP
ncbi:MAG: ABC-2 type transporter [Chloroflexi bacterium OLB14]|nr:MAG: ABC-2 type transporter [Chloroflexi bacterium OLB14]